MFINANHSIQAGEFTHHLINVVCLSKSYMAWTAGINENKTILLLATRWSGVFLFS